MNGIPDSLSANLGGVKLVYVPNQFFEIGLPVLSKSAVRVLAHMIAETCRYPHAISGCTFTRSQLSVAVGLVSSRSQKALGELEENRFIMRVESGADSSSRQKGARYAICCDASGIYTRDFRVFAGFIPRGHRTPTPIEYLCDIVPAVTNSVYRVLGVHIRETFGRENDGAGKKSVALSVRRLSQLTGLNDHNTILAALKTLDGKYLIQVQRANKVPSKIRATKEYTTVWHKRLSAAPDGLVNPRFADERVRHANGAIVRSQTPDGICDIQQCDGRDLEGVCEAHATISRGSESRSKPEQSGAKSQADIVQNPEQGSIKNPSTIKEEYKNKNQREQQQTHTKHTPFSLGKYKELCAQGISRQVASDLVNEFSAEHISRQIENLTRQKSVANAAGFLVAAIKNNYSGAAAQPKLSANTPGNKAPASDFVSHFYAEFGGNASEPIAKPTPWDISAADDLCNRLVADCPEVHDPREWGRAFARFVKRQLPTSRLQRIECDRAVRLFGDAFLTIQLEIYTQKAREEADERRRQQREKLRPGYLEYLRGRENDARTKSPDRYSKFVEDRANKRAGIENSHGSLIRNEALLHFDDELERLNALQRFFPKQIKNFDSWISEYEASGKKAIANTSNCAADAAQTNDHGMFRACSE